MFFGKTVGRIEGGGGHDDTVRYDIKRWAGLD